MKFDTIVAYTYQAEMLCPSCTVIGIDTYHSPLEDAEDVLDRAARLRDIDRTDERSFDSGDFPKVVFADQVEWIAVDAPDDSWIGQGFESERCDSCGEALI